MEPRRGRRGLRRPAGPGRAECAREHLRGLARQLRQLPLQRLQLCGRVAGSAAREEHIHQLQPGDQVCRRLACHAPQVALLPRPLRRVGGPRGELRQRVQRANVRGIAAQRPFDLRARVARPPRQGVHAGQHQGDVVVRRVERRGPVQLRLGLAVPPRPQIHEPQVGVPERLVRGERDHLLKRRFRLGQPVLLQVGQSPGAGGEGRVAARRLVSAPRAFPACQHRHQQQPDHDAVSRGHSCSSSRCLTP